MGRRTYTAHTTEHSGCGCTMCPSAHEIRAGARFALLAKTVREKREKKKTICFLGNKEEGGVRGRGAAALGGGWW